MTKNRAASVVAVLAVLAATAVHAQERLELKLELSPVTSSVRSHAPVALDVRLESWSGELLEGYLELVCYDDGKLLHRQRTPDLVLSAGERWSRTLLPPLILLKDQSQVTVQALWVTESSRTPLGTYPVRVPVYTRRSLVMGLIHSEQAASDLNLTRLAGSLRLDGYGSRPMTELGLVSAPSLIDPGDLRADGLSLCSFDLLLLTGPGLAELPRDDLTAIADWVEAGGSLLVVVDRSLSEDQQEFFNRIAAQQSDDVIPFSDADQSQPGSQVQLRYYRPGLGRVVVAPELPDTQNVTQMRKLVAFLWKIRQAQKVRLLNEGSLDIADGTIGWQRHWSGGAFGMQRPFRPYPLVEAGELEAILLPDEVQGIPFGVVVVILTLFLIAIVPVDYYVLGRLNCRRYTWILVPLVSLAFTWFTAGLGNSYLGSTDYRTGLEFVDLTAGNRVVRSSRYELLFTATQREAVTRMKQSLFIPLPSEPIRGEDEWDTGTLMRAMEPVQQESVGRRQESDPPDYQGSLPASYEVRLQMQQWSPQLNRQTSLAGDRDVPPLELDGIGRELLKTPGVAESAEWRQQVRERIQATLPEARILLFNGTRILDLNGEPQPDVVDRHGVRDSRLQGLIRRVSHRPSEGLFSVVSQISPGGAAGFEDLTIVDQDNRSEWLLVILTAEGDDYVVYRRLFHGGS